MSEKERTGELVRENRGVRKRIQLSEEERTDECEKENR